MTVQELLDLSEHRRGTGELRRRARAKVAEVDARIGQLRQVRERLLAVVAAECDSLTDCSCGLGAPLPALDRAGPDQAAAEPGRRRVASSSNPPTASSPPAAQAESPGEAPV